MSAAVQQIPPQISMAAAREEAEMVLFDSVRNVLEEAKLKPGQVGLFSCVSVGQLNTSIILTCDKRSLSQAKSVVRMNCVAG